MSLQVADRELLELAAKASGHMKDLQLTYQESGEISVGVEYSFKPASGFGSAFDVRGWNPLDNDGDALRLAAKLNLSIITSWGFDGKPSGSVGAMLGAHEDLQLTSTKHGNDPCAAWRRCIVRAAAEIGRAMP